MPQGKANNRKREQKAKINMSDLSQGGNCKPRRNEFSVMIGAKHCRTNFFRFKLPLKLLC
jgi:hypothetical protein